MFCQITNEVKIEDIKMKCIIPKLLVLTFFFLLMLTSSALSASIIYQYDQAGRLVSASYGGQVISFNYDAMGNMLQRSVSIDIDKGDVNNDGATDLEDAILILKNLVGEPVNLSSLALYADVDGDNKLDKKEIIYILQNVSQMR